MYVRIDLDVRRMPVAEESGVEVPYNQRVDSIVCERKGVHGILGNAALQRRGCNTVTRTSHHIASHHARKTKIPFHYCKAINLRRPALRAFLPHKCSSTVDPTIPQEASSALPVPECSASASQAAQSPPPWPLRQVACLPSVLQRRAPVQAQEWREAGAGASFRRAPAGGPRQVARN